MVRSVLWYPVCSAATQPEDDLSKMAAAFPALSEPMQRLLFITSVFSFLLSGSSSASGRTPSQQLGGNSGRVTDDAAHRAGLSRLPHPHWSGQEPGAQPGLTQPMESRQHVGPG